MKAIKKFDLSIEPSQRVKMPYNSTILDLGIANNKPHLWVLTDSSYSAIERTFLIVAPEKEVSPRLNKTNYVGSFEHRAEIGSVTLHVFEELGA